MITGFARGVACGRPYFLFIVRSRVPGGDAPFCLSRHVIDTYTFTRVVNVYYYVRRKRVRGISWTFWTESPRVRRPATFGGHVWWKPTPGRRSIGSVVFIVFSSRLGRPTAFDISRGRRLNGQSFVDDRRDPIWTDECDTEYDGNDNNRKWPITTERDGKNRKKLHVIDCLI